MAGGFIGIGRYPQEVRERLVTIVPPGPWKSAFFMLPEHRRQSANRYQPGGPPGAAQASRAAARRARPLCGSPTQGGSGTTASLASSSRSACSICAAPTPDLAGVTFESVAQITVRNDVVHVTQEFPLEGGSGVALIPPLALAKVVRVDGSRLDWKGLNAESDLAAGLCRVEIRTEKLHGTPRPHATSTDDGHRPSRWCDRSLAASS